MKNIIKIAVIILFSLLLIFIVYKISNITEKPFNKIEFNKNHHIYNFSKNNSLDTIVEAGLETLKIDTVTIIIKNIDKQSIIENGEVIELDAYIKKYDGIYYIFISNYDKEHSITILSHELVHLKQYYTNRLIISDVCIWENDTIDISIMKYEERPWEAEAFLYQSRISKEINTLLYK